VLHSHQTEIQCVNWRSKTNQASRVCAFGSHRRGYAVGVARDVRYGSDYTQAADYGVPILDFALPGISGLELLRERCCQGIEVLTRMVLARDAIGDRAEGFDAVADDYLVKLFATIELLARVRALPRRATPRCCRVRPYPHH